MTVYRESNDIYRAENEGIQDKMKWAKKKLKKDKFLKHQTWSYAQISDERFRLEEEVDKIIGSKAYSKEIKQQSAISSLPKHNKCIDWIDNKYHTEIKYREYKDNCREIYAGLNHPRKHPVSPLRKRMRQRKIKAVEERISRAYVHPPLLKNCAHSSVDIGMVIQGNYMRMRS